MREEAREVKRRKIEDTVVQILEASDFETATEQSVRTAAAQRLGFDLSDLPHKRLVRNIIESFLLSTAPSDEKLDEHKEISFASHENSGRVICKLSEKINVAVHKFKGQALVSIRDYYVKDGKPYPSKIGISLSAKQWSSFRNSFPAIVEAITKLEARIRSQTSEKQTEKRKDSDPDSMLHPPAANWRKPIDADNSISSCALKSEGQTPINRNRVNTDGRHSITSAGPQVEIASERNETHGNTSEIVPSPFSPRTLKQHDSLFAFSPEILVPIKPARLTGRNYHCWMHQMEFFLKQLNIAYVLWETRPSISPDVEANIEETVQAKAARQKWLNDDYLCRHHILNSLSDNLFYLYSKKNYRARELWEELKSMYNDDFGTKRSHVNKYIHFQMVDGVSVIQQVQELQTIADSVMASGIWMDENFHVSVIVSKLPPSWKEFRARLMLEDFLPLNMLMHRLMIEDDRRFKKKGPPYMRELGLENKYGAHRKELKKLCFSCGNEGHISKYCPERKHEVCQKSNEKGDGIPQAETNTEHTEEN